MIQKISKRQPATDIYAKDSIVRGAKTLPETAHDKDDEFGNGLLVVLLKPVDCFRWSNEADAAASPGSACVMSVST